MPDTRFSFVVVHEAGHAVVAYALGRYPHRIQINDPNASEHDESGANHTKICRAEDNETITALVCVAGYIAECLFEEQEPSAEEFKEMPHCERDRLAMTIAPTEQLLLECHRILKSRRQELNRLVRHLSNPENGYKITSWEQFLEVIRTDSQ